jgi:poly-beta-1,6-N-acetyl-D-glucosamine synthase
MDKKSQKNNYVLVTPARNEDAFISKTIESVLRQTRRPLHWVIVNDASSDKTQEVVERLINKYEFISLINLNRNGDRNFGQKANAFERGALFLNDYDYRFIGNLDADIYLEPDYYKNILEKFIEDPKLGIAGGAIYTKIRKGFLTSDQTQNSVAGAIQLFRKECYKDIGGYIPLEYGGIDAAAEIKARMQGWRVKKFLEYKVYEMRRTGSAEVKPIEAMVREGRRFHSLGYDLLFYLTRLIYRIKDPPIVIGSMAALYGFLKCFFSQKPILLPKEVVSYLRNEQRNRLKNTFKNFV